MLGIDESYVPHKTCLDRRLLPGLTAITGVEEQRRCLVCLWDGYPRHGSSEEVCGAPWSKRVAWRGDTGVSQVCHNPKRAAVGQECIKSVTF